MSRLRSPIKIRQLEYFLAAAKTLHFSNAASALFVSQPTLSHQIAELEAQLGTQLFNRDGKLVQLTDAGETFRAYANRAIAELDSGLVALAELDGLKSGRLRVGVSQSFVRQLLPPILGQFVTNYPGIHLTVTELTAGDIEHGLAEGVLDVGIAFAPAMLTATEPEPLIEERLVLVIRSTHPMAQRSYLRMGELHQQPIALLSTEYFTRKIIDEFLKTADAVPNIVCETNSIAVLLSIAGTSEVASIIPESAVSNVPELRAIPLVEPSPVRVSALLWYRHSYRTHAVRAFAELVRQRFRDLFPR